MNTTVSVTLFVIGVVNMAVLAYLHCMMEWYTYQVARRMMGPSDLIRRFELEIRSARAIGVIALISTAVYLFVVYVAVVKSADASTHQLLYTGIAVTGLAALILVVMYVMGFFHSRGNYLAAQGESLTVLP